MRGLSPDYFHFQGYLHAVVWYSDKEVLSGLDGLCVHCVSSPSLYLSVCSMISSIIVPRAPYENCNTFYGEPEALMVLVNVLMVCALIYTLNNMHIHWTSELLPTCSHILQRSLLTTLVYGQDSYIMVYLQTDSPPSFILQLSMATSIYNERIEED